MKVEAFRRSGLYGWRVRNSKGHRVGVTWPAEFPSPEAALIHAATFATELLASFPGTRGYRSGYGGR